LLGIHGLVQVAPGAAFIHGLHRAVIVGVGGDEDADDIGLEPAGAFHELHAAFAGHALVSQEDADARTMLFQNAETIGGIRGRVDDILILKDLPEVAQRFFLIIHVKDVKRVLGLAGHGLSGAGLKVRINSVYSPGWL
jgi:hypothetical protein